MTKAIKYARKGMSSLWLEHDGYTNKYIVSDYDLKAEKTSFKSEYETFDEAESVFLDMCESMGMTPEVVS